VGGRKVVESESKRMSSPQPTEVITLRSSHAIEVTRATGPGLAVIRWKE
jgi:hypothetical protein